MPSSHQVRRNAEESRPFLAEEGIDDVNLEDYEERNHKRRRRYQFVLALLVTAIIAAALVVGIVLAAQESGKGKPSPSSNVIPTYKHAAVAADATICSQVGKAVLFNEGGNAVDAAIATLLCNGLATAHSMGIGGGFFMTIYNRTSGKSTVIDARETAPGKATEDMYENDHSSSSVGPLSIAVPSEIKGYWYAHQKYGSRPWRELFQPAITMAIDGFPVPIALSNAIRDANDTLINEPSLRVIFMNNETGQLFKEGEVMTRPQLGETLRVISEEGMEAFYNGSLTDAIIKDLQDIGSIITREDLINYKVLEKEPLEITLNNEMRMMSPPPPGSGAVLSFILNILEGYSLKPEDIATDKNSTLTYHRIVEAFKFAYAKRTDLGDEDFVNVTELVRNLTSDAYADSIRKLITDNSTHGTDYYGPTFYDHVTTGTSHLSIIDQFGNAVSVTSTINARFGSKRRGMKTGIIFNDEMDDFSSPNITNDYGIPPSPANFIVPGKRPLSSMCPAVIINKDGSVSKVVGAAGGSKITTATAWVTALNLWLGKDIQAAIYGPRMHHQLLPPYIGYEGDFGKPVLDGLLKLGHNLTTYSPGSSIVQGIDVRDGFIYACSDFRKGGTPDGF